jgi:serine/threonine-protein kinase
VFPVTASGQGLAELRAGTLVADRFLLDGPLGKGGMGAVWRAQHTALKIPCAVKFLNPECAASAEMRARFGREAVAAASLRSAHVVQILDHGVWEGTPYIAMELLDGEDLAQRLKRARRLSSAETAAVIGQVARALTRAHAAGLVHRDLKPGNIFLARDDDREIVKVLDFGIAKVQGPERDGITLTGQVLGTPTYMSPEQARGIREVDHRTDLWALGVIAFRCLTGKLPFDGPLGDLMMKIMHEPLPVPSRIAAVPAGFDAWWARAANRDPERRFQSAKELAEALGVVLGASPWAEGTPSSQLGMPPTVEAASEPSTAARAAVSSAARRGVGWSLRQWLVAVVVVMVASAASAVAFFSWRAPGLTAPSAPAAPATIRETAVTTVEPPLPPTGGAVPTAHPEVVAPQASAARPATQPSVVATATPRAPWKRPASPASPASPKTNLFDDRN